MARPKSRKTRNTERTNIAIVSVIVLICLSIPIFYFFFVRDTIDINDANNFLTGNNTIRTDLDFGEAWFNSKAISIQDGYGGHFMVRASLRVPSRENARKVCERHPHLADTILRILDADPELREGALNGEDRAGKTLLKALEKKLGSSLFTEARLIDIKQEGHENQVQPFSYECSHIGVRVIMRDAPEGLRYYDQKFEYHRD